MGNPDDDAKNITIPFNDYIKNVASSELYPTWPEDALRANIYAQISFALNRIYTEHYRSQGYNFDITSSAFYDQKYMDDRDIFDSIGKIVDEIFDSYIVRQGSSIPLLAKHCNGITSVCNGLSQWGSLSLAQNGYNPYDILRHYFGDDIYIETDVPVGSIVESHPEFPLKLGSQGPCVKTIKDELNLVGKNYTAIPEIKSDSDIFDTETLNAVIEFQRIFNLVPDGIVDKGTWYKLKSIYDSAKAVDTLFSDAVLYEEKRTQYKDPLKLGSQGDSVKTVRHLLAMIAYFDPDISTFTSDGIYGVKTESACKAFQKKHGLNPDGIVSPETWELLNKKYVDLLNSFSPEIKNKTVASYPGHPISLGMRNKDVEHLQTYLSSISTFYPWASTVDISGYFDGNTYEAVKKVQKQTKQKQTGIVGPSTWFDIARLHNEISPNKKL